MMGLRPEGAARRWSRYPLRHEWVDVSLASLEQPVMEILEHAVVEARLAPAVEVDPETELLPQRTVLGLRLAPRGEKHDGRGRGERGEERAATGVADPSPRPARASAAPAGTGRRLPRARRRQFHSQASRRTTPAGSRWTRKESLSIASLKQKSSSIRASGTEAA